MGVGVLAGLINNLFLGCGCPSNLGTYVPSLSLIFFFLFQDILEITLQSLVSISLKKKSHNKVKNSNICEFNEGFNICLYIYNIF